MSNVQLYVAIGLPGLLVLVNIAISLNSGSRIETKIEAMRTDMRGDMRTLESIGYEHHGRITKLENK